MALFQDAVSILDNSNNKQVKKIEDSNGNIIWGSQSDFPYRKLEYLQGEHITYGFDTGQSPQRNSYFRIDAEYIHDTTITNGSQQQGRGAVSNAQRFAIGFSKDSNNNISYFGGIGSNWNTLSTPAYTSGRHTLVVQGPDATKYGSGQGYYIDDTFYPTSNTVGTPSTYYSVYVFGSRGNTSSTDPAQGELSCKLYYAEIGYGSSNINARIYPAQRKSDGQLGLIRIDGAGNVAFLTPRSGETGTYTAGPVADEYWDLQ